MAVRKRPAMYVGSTGLFGFINYLVCSVALLIELRPSRIAIAVGEGGFVVECDAVLPIEETSQGRFSPFEVFPDTEHGRSFEGTVLAALSERLTVEIRGEDRTETLEFRRGSREAVASDAVASSVPGTVLKFAPDTSILSETEVSAMAFRSYLRRLSFLHQGVRFSLSIGRETQEFFSERGIVDLFASVTAPYQVLHEPIHFVAEAGSLRLETIFVFHSWREEVLWCFINQGRAVEGGTHEEGLDDALKQLYRDFGMPKRPKAKRIGIIGILSIRYPDAVWEGCIKGRIGNPELRTMVRDLVVQGASKWLEERPEVAEQLRRLEVFQFPEVWYS